MHKRPLFFGAAFRSFDSDSIISAVTVGRTRKRRAECPCLHPWLCL